MKLRPKSEIENLKVKERKVEIDAGAKLAQKIDLLRQTINAEESNLYKFRTESIKILKKEISDLVAQKQAIENEIHELTEEKILKEGPLDLRNAYAKVSKDQNEIDFERESIETQKVSLLSRESQIISVESQLKNLELELEAKENQIFEKEKRINSLLTEKEHEKDKAVSLRRQLEKDKEQFLLDVKLANENTSKKETELRLKAVDLNNKEEALNQKEIEIEKEKKHIASQQQTLRVAWENIRKLQKNG